MKPVTEFVISTLAVACDVQESVISAETALEGIGFDSLSAATVISVVESTYAREMEQEEFVLVYEAITVGDLIAIVEGVQRGRAHNADAVVNARV